MAVPSVQAAVEDERLPFTVRVVHSEADLAKAVDIRHSAYARHVPEFASTLRLPEDSDFEDGTVVLLAESKLDGSPLGTMRIQTNQHGPLHLEESLTLPEQYQGLVLAEASRLGVTGAGAGRMVKTVLFKAFYLYCRQLGVDYMVATGRAPVDRQYVSLLFKDMYPGMGYIPLPHVGNIPHRVMALKVDDVFPLWRDANHPLFDFFFHRRHPDIDLGASDLPHGMLAIQPHFSGSPATALAA